MFLFCIKLTSYAYTKSSKCLLLYTIYIERVYFVRINIFHNGCRRAVLNTNCVCCMCVHSFCIHAIATYTRILFFCTYTCTENKYCMYLCAVSYIHTPASSSYTTRYTLVLYTYNLVVYRVSLRCRQC